MKSKLYTAAVSKYVLSVGFAIILALTASDQGSWTAFADKPDHVQQASESVSLAAPPYTQYVYQQTTLGIGATGAAVATCPSSSTVVGGGYAADSDVTFYTQYKYENGWRGDATNNSGISTQITVYAVCLHNVSGVSVTQVHGQVDVLPGTKKQAVATCPAGSIATGGGFHAYPDGSLRVYNSSKADIGEGWQSWAHNLSGSTKTHHAYVTCLSGSGGTTARILKSVVATPSSTAYAAPKCGSGSLVTGGGFAAQEDLLIYSTSGPYSGDEWRVYVKNTHPSESRTLFGYAICLSLPAQPDVNLTPYKPGSWTNPIVPSTLTGTNTVNDLYVNLDTYIDWAVVNSGPEDILAQFDTCLYLDDVELNCWYTNGKIAGYIAYIEDWILDVTPSPGLHNLKIVTDVNDDIAESDETDNTWSADFYWNASPNADIYITPSSLTNQQIQDQVMTLILEIRNYGSAPLNWSIYEAPTSSCFNSDIPWVSESPDTGTTAPSSTTTIDVVFDSTGLAHGIYQGALCFSSNDPDKPLLAIPITLETIEEQTIFLPLLLRPE